MSATICLTVEVHEPLSLDPAGPLGKVAALYRALLEAGYDADMHTEMDPDDDAPPDPATLN